MPTQTFDDGSTLTTNADGSFSSTPSTDLAATVTTTTSSTKVKKPVVTALIPNPMHQFASWTYSWSLWRLDVPDYNTLVDATDVDTAMAWTPGPTSYVIAEDSGLYPDRRLPASAGLNYNIQDVQLSTTFGLNKSTEHSNLLSGSMTILEPYGVTFIDNLVAASFDGTQYNNYTQQPYMLQLDFHGYDDKGNQLPPAATSLYRKRFPITFLAVKINISNRGAEYKINFAPAGHVAHHEENAKTPKIFQITAGTVDEFFNGPTGLVKQFNEFYINEIKRGNAGYGDSIAFDIDPEILKSSIVNPAETSLSKADPNSTDITVSKNTWTIHANTSIIKIITKVIAQTSWLLNDQLGQETGQGVPDQTVITNLIKTIVQTKYQGVDQSGAPISATGVDNLRNSFPKAFTYKIHQYPSWKGAHPVQASMPDSTPYTIKSYNYLYTGQNIDIIDLKLQFDTTYYTSVLSYNREIAASQTTAQSGGDYKLSVGSAINLIPSSIGLGVPALLGIKTTTPYRVKNAVNDPKTSTGLTSRAAGITGADVLKSNFSSLNGDMLKVDLTIVGDPTLLKQDDWAYAPSPTKSTIFNSWDTMSQSTFAQKYGHVRTDAGELIVALTINTPLDIDTDYTNSGLMAPQPWSKQSLFSGQYTIIKVESKFANGKFEQTLHLARYINSDFSSAFSQSTNTGRVAVLDPTTGKPVAVNSAIAVSQTNQSSSVPSNGGTSDSSSIEYNRD
jgi:hypothetical protein